MTGLGTSQVAAGLVSSRPEVMLTRGVMMNVIEAARVTVADRIARGREVGLGFARSLGSTARYAVWLAGS